ncbi:MAG TPA: cytochrome b5 domain-containing protein [Candidatus Limiplasma sp.]|nr:cytochrome b5 domain-containing protein [Candidatus Limiplasma sp.]HPS81271.1 cytochrome b5 domain-containing protein [Candidatus Limiplasma sp.]
MKTSLFKKSLLALTLLTALAMLAGCASTATQPATETPQSAATAVVTEAPQSAATAVATEAPQSAATAVVTEAPQSAATETAAAQSTAEALPTVTLPVFTAETLATYNGQNGNPAYIAVSGKVYDVTNVPEWKNGSHFGRFQAGVDLTDALKLSPHGPSKLESVPIVGLYQAN